MAEAMRCVFVVGGKTIFDFGGLLVARVGDECERCIM
jgi:hypothetical protein